MIIKEYYFQAPKPLYGTKCNTLSGHRAYQYTLKILVDEIPHDEMVFKKYGPFLYAEKEGFVRIYKHEPGTTNGFAGRTIALNVEGRPMAFTGSLWDPMSYRQQKENNVPSYRACSVTTKQRVMELGYTFYAGYLTKQLYYNLWNAAMNIVYCAA